MNKNQPKLLDVVKRSLVVSQVYSADRDEWLTRAAQDLIRALRNRKVTIKISTQAIQRSRRTHKPA